jgi:hypothetical protein
LTPAITPNRNKTGLQLLQRKLIMTDCYRNPEHLCPLDLISLLGFCAAQSVSQTNDETKKAMKLELVSQLTQ